MDTKETIRASCRELADRLDRWKWSPETTSQFFSNTADAGRVSIIVTHAIDALRDLTRECIPLAITQAQADEAAEASTRA